MSLQQQLAKDLIKSEITLFCQTCRIVFAKFTVEKHLELCSKGTPDYQIIAIRHAWNNDHHLIKMDSPNETLSSSLLGEIGKINHYVQTVKYSNPQRANTPFDQLRMGFTDQNGKIGIVVCSYCNNPYGPTPDSWKQAAYCHKQEKLFLTELP
jgi:hypothetical protein